MWNELFGHLEEVLGVLINGTRVPRRICRKSSCEVRCDLRELLEEGLHQVQLIFGQLYALQCSVLVDCSNIFADIGEDSVLGHRQLHVRQLIADLYRVVRAKELPKCSVQ